jgi:GNAT superfamily N-acetyltransferase
VAAPPTTPRRAVHLRPATAADAPALSALALAAKAHWDYPEAWLREWAAELTITPERIATTPVWVAALAGDDEPAGFFGLEPRPEPALWVLEHFWVHPRTMGRGVGRELFHHAAALARAQGGRWLAIDADPHAEPFYLHLGAARVGEVRGSVAGQPRVRPLLRLDLDGWARRSS